MIFSTLPVLSMAGGIYVQSGASITLNNGTINLGCNDAIIAGSLNLGAGAILNTRDFNISGGSVSAGSGQVQFAGDWGNGGSFTPGTSQVTMQDGCSKTTTAVTGDTDFYAFTATSDTAKTLQFAAGSTQLFSDSLTLQGVIGNLLLIRSSIPGSQAFFYLDPNATQNIFTVDVRDNNASGGQWVAIGDATDFDSVDSGNNINWFLGGLEFAPVPTLSSWALILLTMTMMTFVFRHRRRLHHSGEGIQ